MLRTHWCSTPLHMLLVFRLPPFLLICTENRICNYVWSTSIVRILYDYSCTLSCQFVTYNLSYLTKS